MLRADYDIEAEYNNRVDDDTPTNCRVVEELRKLIAVKAYSR